LPQASRRPPVGSGAVPRARHFHADPELRRRGEPIAPVAVPARVLDASKRARYEPRRKPASRPKALWNVIEQNLLQISCVFLVLGSAGWGLLLYNELSSSGLFGGTPNSVYATVGDADVVAAKTDSMGAAKYMPAGPAPVAVSRSVASDYQTAKNDLAARLGGAPASAVIAQDWSIFQPKQDVAQAPVPAKVAKITPAVGKTTPAVAKITPPVQVASIDSAPPQIAPRNPAVAPVAPRIPLNIEAKTSLVDFTTAPFPYHGMVPGLNRPFLSGDAQSDLHHVNFRGRVFWESKTFSDDHVLLHIPPGFDPSRPAVMVVFFHGHGATLARDVRDRQQLPDQISAAGINAVLVAPQFAYDAADSSAGKFWEPDGFKRFLGEAAQKLATLYGDPRSTAAFANMPIVIVSYSGGFGPTLSVLARGGANPRIRGLVLLDSLYAGIDQFADWIADNRSAFFVSSYTPYTAHHNFDLEHLLAERAVPYGSELRANHLRGMVAFLPADVPHRDFVTHAWDDDPVEDILVRMDDVVPTVQATGSIKPHPSAALAAARN
jgi:hypothetical protein